MVLAGLAHDAPEDLARAAFRPVGSRFGRVEAQALIEAAGRITPRMICPKGNHDQFGGRFYQIDGICHQLLSETLSPVSSRDG